MLELVKETLAKFKPEDKNHWDKHGKPLKNSLMVFSANKVTMEDVVKFYPNFSITNTDLSKPVLEEEKDKETKQDEVKQQKSNTVNAENKPETSENKDEEKPKRTRKAKEFDFDKAFEDIIADINDEDTETLEIKIAQMQNFASKLTAESSARTATLIKARKSEKRTNATQAYLASAAKRDNRVKRKETEARYAIDRPKGH